MSHRIKYFFISFGLIFLYLLLNELTTLIALPFKDNTFLLNIILIVGSFVSTFVIAFILKDELISKWDDFKKNKNDYIPKIVKYWAIGFSLMYVTNIIISILFLNGIAPNEEANREMIKLYPYYMAISVSLTGPIAEELLFRLTFKRVFSKKIVYILFTGILFGLAHMLTNSTLIEFLYIIPYSVLGITFSALVYDTDNIYTSIFAHIFHNVLTLMIIFRFM